MDTFVILSIVWNEVIIACTPLFYTYTLGYRRYIFFCQSLLHHFGQILNVVKRFSAVVIVSYIPAIAHNRNYLKQINIFSLFLVLFVVFSYVLYRAFWPNRIRLGPERWLHRPVFFNFSTNRPSILGVVSLAPPPFLSRALCFPLCSHRNKAKGTLLFLVLVF